MTHRPGAALIAHGGGPTQVINASLAGVWEECAAREAVTGLYGARHGLAGVLAGEWIHLSALPSELVERIGRSPGSALGSSRQGASAEDYDRMIDLFRARDVRFFFYTGGNGSMVTALELARRAHQSGCELSVIGIPKTIDNDLCETDHSPGYGSTARFFASAVRDIGADNRALPGTVTVVEVMGRNVGWLVAATALARAREDDPPHLIYFPEQPLATGRLLADVERVYRRLNRAVIALCEGQADDRGGHFGAETHAADGFQRRLAANLGHVVAQLIMRELKVKARSEKPGVLGRSSAAFVSETDRLESAMCGRAAVRAALDGRTGAMVTLDREPGATYSARTGLVDLDKVAGRERRFPVEWIAPSGHDVTGAFREWVSPLAGPIEPHPRIDL